MKIKSIFILLMLLFISVFIVSCDNPSNDSDDIIIAPRKKVTISFNSNGGSDIQNVAQTVNQAYELLAPTKAGYTFDGWYHGDELVKANGIWTINTNVELIARWTANKYSINYITIGGVNANPTTYTIEDEVVLKSLDWSTNDDAIEYIFDGWYMDADFKKPIEKIEQGTVGNIDVYAKWNVVDVPEEKTKTQITISADGYECDGEIKIFTVGENYILPILEKEGYIFSGWKNKENSTHIQSSGIWIETDSELVLIPNWIKRAYSITYDFNGGIASNGEFPKSYNIATDKLQIGIPTRNGYRFIGWQTDREIEYYHIIKKGSSGNISLKAMWHKINYTYQDNQGIQYLLKDDNTLCVVGYIGEAGSISIPSIYNGYKVTEIGQYAFCGYGEELSKIYSSGFYRCDIPDTVNRISKGAFIACDDLKVQLANNSTISVDEWTNSLVVEDDNEHVLDVIQGKRPAIGWNKYWIPGQ